MKITHLHNQFNPRCFSTAGSDVVCSSYDFRTLYSVIWLWLSEHFTVFFRLCLGYVLPLCLLNLRLWTTVCIQSHTAIIRRRNRENFPYCSIKTYTLYCESLITPTSRQNSSSEGSDPRLGGKFHSRYLPVAFTGNYRSGKYSSSGKYWQILANWFFCLKILQKS